MESKAANLSLEAIASPHSLLSQGTPMVDLSPLNCGAFTNVRLLPEEPLDKAKERLKCKDLPDLYYTMFFEPMIRVCALLSSLLTLQKKHNFEELGLGELYDTAPNHLNFVEELNGKYSIVSVLTEVPFSIQPSLTAKALNGDINHPLGVEEHYALRTHARVRLGKEALTFCRVMNPSLSRSHWKTVKIRTIFKILSFSIYLPQLENAHLRYLTTTALTLPTS